jgi:hypothetical protein
MALNRREITPCRGQDLCLTRCGGDRGTWSSGGPLIDPHPIGIESCAASFNRSPPSPERFGDIGQASLHRWVRTNPNRVIDIADLVNDSKWNSNSSDGYRSSASFLALLIEHYGAARLKLVYHARSSQLPARIQEVYGAPLEWLAAEWRSAVR